MKYYEYDAQGWLIGWHEDDTRPNSTPLDFHPIPPAHARWDGVQWTDDPSREIAQQAAEDQTRTLGEAARQTLLAFDRNTATAQEMRDAIAALIRHTNINTEP